MMRGARCAGEGKGEGRSSPSEASNGWDIAYASDTGTFGSCKKGMKR